MRFILFLFQEDLASTRMRNAGLFRNTGLEAEARPAVPVNSQAGKLLCPAQRRGGGIGRVPGTWPRAQVSAAQADRVAAQLYPPAREHRIFSTEQRESLRSPEASRETPLRGSENHNELGKIKADQG